MSMDEPSVDQSSADYGNEDLQSHLQKGLGEHHQLVSVEGNLSDACPLGAGDAEYLGNAIHNEILLEDWREEYKQLAGGALFSKETSRIEEMSNRSDEEIKALPEKDRQVVELFRAIISQDEAADIWRGATRGEGDFYRIRYDAATKTATVEVFQNPKPHHGVRDRHPHYENVVIATVTVKGKEQQR